MVMDLGTARAFGDGIASDVLTREWKAIAQMPYYVYRLLGRSGNVLYIGTTKCLLQRVKQHRQSAMIPFKGVEFIEFVSKEGAAIAESSLIKFLRPRYNSKGLSEIDCITGSNSRMRIRL